jgi:hypothetical protein
VPQLAQNRACSDALAPQLRHCTAARVYGLEWLDGRFRQGVDALLIAVSNPLRNMERRGGPWADRPASGMGAR